MNAARPLTAALALVLSGTSCSTAPAPFQGSPTRGQMIAHYELAVELRGHAIRGDLQRFTATSQALADLDPARDLPSEVILQLGPLRWEAQAGANARTTDAAALAAARIARTCGECHEANGVPLRPRLSREEASSRGVSAEHMAALAWVTELLWEGLVGPSSSSWNVGASELVRAGVLPDALLEEVEQRDIRLASERLQRLAGDAAAAQDPDQRVRALGEIWGTCSGCHVSER